MSGKEFSNHSVIPLSPIQYFDPMFSLNGSVCNLTIFTNIWWSSASIPATNMLVVSHSAKTCCWGQLWSGRLQIFFYDWDTMFTTALSQTVDIVFNIKSSMWNTVWVTKKLILKFQPFSKNLNSWNGESGSKRTE